MNTTNGTVGADSIIAELDALEDMYLQVRSVFPTLGDDLVGHCQFPTAPYYMRRGYMAEIKLKDPITSEFIAQHRRLGKWINENAIIRLYGIMQYHHLVGDKIKIDQTLPSWQEVDLMRLMRNAFTKTRLNYRPEEKSKNMRLRQELMSYFKLRNEDFAEGEIPTPIDTVVEPIFKGCRKYIAAKWKSA